MINFGILDVVPKQLEILNGLQEYGNVVYLGNMEKHELFHALKDIDILLIRLYKIDEEILKNASRLRAVIKAGVGVDHIDVEAATQLGIHVVVSPGNHISVAETAIMLMLAVARQLPQKNKNTSKVLNLLGTELCEKKLGLVGFGRIGSHVAKIAGDGLGMKIAVYDPYIAQGDLHKNKWTYITDLTTLIQTSDVVSLHCPLTKDTFHLIDKQILDQMKRDAIIINTSRGAVIDEEALVEALKNKQIAGAGLDVVEIEPLEDDNPLLQLDNVIVSPHRLTQTPESIMRQAKSMFNSAVSLSKDNIPLESINQKQFVL